MNTNTAESPSSQDSPQDSDSNQLTSTYNDSGIATPHWQDPDLDPLDPIALDGYLKSTRSKLLARSLSPTTSLDSQQLPQDNDSDSAGADLVLASQLCQDIRGLLPTRLQLKSTWSLVYSMEQDGTSLHTLYRKMAQYAASSTAASRPGFVLVVKDDHSNLFGAYVNEPIVPHDNRRYAGNGDCFLWKSTCLNSRPQSRSLSRSVSHSTTSCMDDGSHSPSHSQSQSRSDSHSQSQSGSDSHSHSHFQPYSHSHNKDLAQMRSIPHANTDPSISTTTDRLGSSVSDDGDIPDNHRFEAFPYTGLNDFVMYCTRQFLSLGGGDGHYGLWLDDSLATGVSSRCLTFGNAPLSDRQKFHIFGLEVWRIG